VAVAEDRLVVAIVGGGLAGTLTAIGLLRAARPVEVVLVERSGDFGPGVAYRTQDPHHLLNQPAARMSAFVGDLDHFRRWAERCRGDGSPAAFHPRSVYGDYLRELLDEAVARRTAGNALRRVTGDVVAVAPWGDAAWLALRDGRTIACDRAVLATGPPPGSPPAGLPADPRIVADPWAAGALQPPPAGATALIAGTGLTAVDAALSLSRAGARVIAASRHGLLPHTHLPGLRSPAAPPRPAVWPGDAAALERFVRAHVARTTAGGLDWRDAVDGIRPLVADLWRALPASERRQLLGSRLRRWEVCRHRMAPAVARRLDELRASGRLEILAGTVAGVQPDREGLDVTLRGGNGSERAVRAARLVVCTGPAADIGEVRDPLLRGLIAAGHALPDPLRLGLRTAPTGALLDRLGRPSGVLWTLGALRRGDLWESTAVAEIRAQAAALAGELAAPLPAAWVEPATSLAVPLVR
jgi:uncharacterized NAD(P)/FAD-binding protein YdhS